jgi:pyruvate ferredoxin oxidoreductase beta subunit
MPSLKELSTREERLSGGHRACSGCAFPVIVRQTLLTCRYPVVVTAPTGCLEVVTTIFPFTAWKVPFIHSAFENAAATISGIETAYRALRKKGIVAEDMRFIAFGGDGGTYDIGLQALSGALERGHRFLYICYDNEAYMNTGIQRSGATPFGARTTTSPVGKVMPGKMQKKKNLTEIVVAHGIPYAAQAVPGLWRDFTTKVEKALEVNGPSFINVLSPCNLGWGTDPSLSLELTRLAADTCIWPLYEVKNGRYRITYRPKEKKPVEEFLSKQARFRHLFSPENKWIIEEIQKDVDARWERLEKLEEMGKEEEGR